MKKIPALIFPLLLLLWAAPRVCPAQEAAGEGYIRTADGVRLFYKVVGDGSETLLAVHGGPGNTLESIRADLEPLAKGRRVIYYDQRGGGRSELIRDADKLAISKHVADLEAVRAHFKLDRVTLLGNSWGGLLAGFYAAAHPDKVERMILHSPAPPKKEFLIEMVEEIQSRMGQRYAAEKRKRFAFVSNPQNWVRAEDPRAVCREYGRLILDVYVTDVESMKRFKGDVCAGPEEAVRYQQVVNMHIWRSLGEWDLRPSLGAVKAPVLVVHGVDDPIPLESSEAWAQGFANAQLLIIKGAGHVPQVEQPEVFFGAVESFLKGGPVTGAKVIRK